MTLEEVEVRATRMAGRPIAISAGFLSGGFGLTDGDRVVIGEPPDSAWSLDIDAFGERYLAPMVHALAAARGQR